MRKMTVDQPVTFTNPLDDSAQSGVIESIDTEERAGDDGKATPVDVYVVRTETGGTIRAERAWLTARKES